MANLTITTLSALGVAKKVAGVAELTDSEGNHADGHTDDGTVIRRDQFETSTLGLATLDLTPNADIRPTGTRWTITLDGHHQFRVLKTADAQTLEEALSDEPTPLGSTALEAEASARATADTTLQTALTAETTRAQTAEATLAAADTAEATARANGDTGLQTAIDALTASDVGADPAGTAAAVVEALRTDTTDVHGIADTAALATKVYADALVDDLSGVTNAPAARSALGLGTAATAAAGAFEPAGSMATEQARALAAEALLIPTVQKAAPNGVATLGADGKLVDAQLPALVIVDTFVVASQAAMLALVAEQGDVAVRTDLSKSFILTTDDPTLVGNWQELLTPTDAVSSVNGRNGAVTGLAEQTDLEAETLRAVTAEGTKATTAALTAETERATAAEATKLAKASNLSDLASAPTARTNLGLGTAATQASTAFVGTGVPAPPVDVQVFTASGTWQKPAAPAGCAAYQAVYVVVIGAGGGGGSGRKGAAASARSGGGGGGGGGFSTNTLPVAVVGATEAVVVGAGGAGGAAQATNSTNGTIGSVGGTSSFGAWLRAFGGNGGTAGNNATFAGATGGVGLINGGPGGGQGTAGGSGTSNTPGAMASGGASAGGVTAADVANAGGAGTGSGAVTRSGGAGGPAGGGNGSAPAVQSGATEPSGGAGGGGGGGGSATAGGAGGAGGLYGGGGGGGGAGTDAVGNSGAGGAGANGIVVVITR